VINEGRFPEGGRHSAEPTAVMFRYSDPNASGNTCTHIRRKAFRCESDDSEHQIIGVNDDSQYQPNINVQKPVECNTIFDGIAKKNAFCVFS
jgi:hypothetical protein